MSQSKGPLDGLRVLELAGAGSIAITGMTLADLGADVVRLDRPAGPHRGMDGGPDDDPVLRGRRQVTADLKSTAGLATALDLAGAADVVLEAYRPGVAERLGIGPEACLARNPRLVYARITGWGQDGPLSQQGGHDINYVGLTGALRAIGRAGERPAPPLNLLGFAGGAMMGVIGVLSALREADATGRGQVVDAAIVDGVSLLSQMVWSFRHRGEWVEQRESNLFDGLAPFYDTYTCADGEHVAVGAMEPQFYAALLKGLGLAGADLPPQLDPTGWPELRARFSAAFARRSRDEWAAVFAELDACVTPVLSYTEAAAHPQLAARSTVVAPGGIAQAAPAPRFSGTPTTAPSPLRRIEQPDAVLTDWLGSRQPGRVS